MLRGWALSLYARAGGRVNHEALRDGIREAFDEDGVVVGYALVAEVVGAEQHALVYTAGDGDSDDTPPLWTLYGMLLAYADSIKEQLRDTRRGAEDDE